MVFVQVKVAAKMTSLSQHCQWFLPFSRIAKFSKVEGKNRTDENRKY